MPNIQELEAALRQYKRLLSARYARQSFFLFSKYIVGYNNKPNHLILPHAHGDLCTQVQYTLCDTKDVGGSKLTEGEGTCYDTFMRYQEPPMPPISNITDLMGPPPTPSIDENLRREPVNIDKDESNGSIKIDSSSSLGNPIGHEQSTSNLMKAPQGSLAPTANGYASGTTPSEVDNPPVIPYADIRKFLLLLMPRGTFKSTITTESFPLYAWLFNPNLRVHIASETLEKALLYAGAIKGHLEGNAMYRDVYKTIYDVDPDVRKSIDKWTNSELNLAGRTSLTREPNLSCGSPDVPKVGQHYDIIIVDDLMGPTNISDTGIEKAINYYKGLLSVLEPGGILIFIGTRWHFKDVYGYILNNEDRFGTIIKAAFNEDSSLFFPERLSQEFLESQQRSQGSFFFSCQYLNKVVDDENADFKRSYFRNEKVNLDDPDNPINTFMTVDPVPPGSEEKNDPDYFAICVGGIDKSGSLYYLDGWLARPTPGEAINKILEMADEWGIKMLGFEAQSFAKLYSFMLKEEMRKRNFYIPVKEIKRSDKRETKAQRIRRLVPYYERGDVIHRLGAKCVTQLEDQLLEFPRGSHDDLIDAFADIVAMAWKPAREGAEDKKEKREKMTAYRQAYRNPITRY